MKAFAPLMGLFRNQGAPPTAVFSSGIGPAPQGEYMRFARAYTTNEIIFASIDLLADSAGEPQIVGRRYRRESPRAPQNRLEMQAHIKHQHYGLGVPYAEINRNMIRNGFYESVPNHPLVRLLNNPNPMSSRGQFWGTMVMDRYIAGNAYALKVGRFMGSGGPSELWRLRPDRVRIIPEAGGIAGYEYNTGRDKIVYPAADVMHFKERHPLNDYYGLSPIAVIYERLSIEENQRGFLRSFYESGGTGPGAVLSVKQKLNQENKDAMRERYKRQFGNATGFRELMIIDANEHTYTPLGLQRGLRDALPTEIDSMQEARIAMVFRIPASILGTGVGMESSSYANKRQDWQVFWDLTMAPLLSDMDDTLNLGLTSEFGAIDEVCFDLGDIRALQEDVDKLQERHRKNFAAGAITWEEMREGIGYDPELDDGTLLIPGNMTPISLKRLEETADEEPEPVAPPAQIAAPVDVLPGNYNCQHCGRWVGKDLLVGSTVYCPKDKEVTVERLENQPISIEIVRDNEGRAVQLLGAKR